MTEEKCSFCEGCGLVKRVQPFCEKENCKNCYLCENNKKTGIYQECSKCMGSGKLKSNKIVYGKK